MVVKRSFAMFLLVVLVCLAVPLLFVMVVIPSIFGLQAVVATPIAGLVQMVLVAMVSLVFWKKWL